MAASAAAKGADKPLIQTMDMLSEGQIDAIRRIPPHGEAAVKPSAARRPASIFTSPERFAEEQARVFRATAVPVTLSALIAPGSALAADGYGVALLVTRDKAGGLRVFYNACRHKGSKVLEGCAATRTPRLVCPYHAWTYGLDGKLIGVPRQETFADLDRDALGLVEVPSRESGGLVWAMLDRQAPPDFSGATDELAVDLDALGIGDAHVYARRTFDLTANWKLVIEPFLEGYHVQRLHARTVGPLFADVPNICDKIGPHIRQISGKADFERAHLDRPGENIHKTITHAYLVFPNTVIVTSPYYISVMILMPRGVDRTVVDYFMLTRRAPDSDKAEQLYAKSFEMIVNVFGNEDFRAAQISHAGLSTGALEEVLYSGLEAAIIDYYEELEGRL